MRMNWAAGLGLLAFVGFAPSAFAADHKDGTLSASGLDNPDSSADINDVFAWTDATGTAAGTKLNLIMSVSPGATTSSKFSNAVNYVFHINAGTTIRPLGAQTETQLVCSFTTAQVVSCWLKTGSKTLDYATGDASSAAGISGTNSLFTVHTGLHDDPFFFNLAGFKKATQTVAGAVAAGAGTGSGHAIASFDAQGCPTYNDAATPTALLGQLKAGCTGSGTAFDEFSPPTTGSNALCVGTGVITNQDLTGNILAIVAQVKLTSVTTSSATQLGVWGSTNH